MTRGVRNRQQTDTPATQTALSAPAPPPMPNSRRPTQPGATATGIPSLCSMWFVQIQKLSKEPRPHGAHGSEAWWPAAHSRMCLLSCANSTVKPVLSVTKSGRGRRRRCGHCRRDTPTRDIIVGDTFQDPRQPGHEDAVPAALRKFLRCLQDRVLLVHAWCPEDGLDKQCSHPLATREREHFPRFWRTRHKRGVSADS